MDIINPIILIPVKDRYFMKDFSIICSGSAILNTYGPSSIYFMNEKGWMKSSLFSYLLGL